MRHTLRKAALSFAVLAVFASPIAYGTATTDPATIKRALEHKGIGSTVTLNFANHATVKGEVLAIEDDSVSIQVQHQNAPTIVALTDIASVNFHPRHDRLRGAFQMGPCVGPLTLLIASPFILVAAATGH